ncbi:MAG: hypothetical protein BWX98_02427 [Candidatus Aminicenantes bacterium ADurb.Bin147]|nr:MAG: hypothetical protein BWX98_02427 [Candidatus Aminicenantes bacterium ADurb.Bin147]
MKKTMTWQTRDGRHELRVEIELVTERHVSADGDALTVPCCEIVEQAYIDDAPEAGCLTMLPEPVGGAVARWGRIGLEADRLAEYRRLRAEIEASDSDWEHTARIRRAMAE